MLPYLRLYLPHLNQYMDVEIFAICDAATAQGAKINILGAFNILWSDQAPILAPSCALAARIRFDAQEAGQKTVRLVISDLSGAQLFELSTSIEVRFRPNQPVANVQIVLQRPRFVLPQFGEYQIRLEIDGQTVKSLRLFAKQRSQTA